MGTESQSVLGAKVRVPRMKAMARERIDEMLASIWDHRIGLVVAPAGSGKTTLLAQFARGSGVPVAWYRAEPADSSAAAALAHLERGLVGSLGLAGGWREIDDAIQALDAWQGERAILAIDDLHVLWGTEAEATIERLLVNLKPGIVMVAATRRAPGFNISRLRVSGELFEMGPEEIRFRSWEVDRLFCDFYKEPLRPDELAELERRTEGWAAGLQLFHLATRGKPAGERRRVLHSLGVRSNLVREYLTRNVLDDLPIHVRDFLLQTCVLGRLTAVLCDEVRGGTSSDALLAELEQRQIFTTPLDEEGSYRYHEVLRSYLEVALVEAVGEAEARRRYRLAGQLLEAHGHLPEALRAYCRADDWIAARGLLGDRGEQVIDQPGAWLESLPLTLLEQDPWLLLASARRAVAEGRWEAALDIYRRAEAASSPGGAGETSRRERLALENWFAPAVSAPGDWTGILRLALVRDPAGVVAREAARLEGATGELTSGLALLLSGQVADAAAKLDAVAARADASPAIAIGAAIGAAMARALSGRLVDEEVVRLGEAAEEAGLPWFVGLTRLVAAVRDADDAEALSSRVAKVDAWGLPLVQLCTGLGRLTTGAEGADLLTEAASGFAAVGAPVLEAWAAAAGSLAVNARGGAGRPGLDAARRGLRMVADTGLTGPMSLAAWGAALADPAHSARHCASARAAAADSGFDLVGFTRSSPPPPDVRPDQAESAPASPATAPTISIRCFGAVEVLVDGAVLDLGVMKPRVRSLLRALALHAGRPVHRDRLIDWLWPAEADSRVGTRNLQVAVSSLRQVLEPGVARGAAAVVVREGDTYGLHLGDGDFDLVDFDRWTTAGREAVAAGETAVAVDALDRALGLYRGELLADEGAVEWVLSERDRLQVAAGDASQLRAELLLDAGHPADAATEAERGLRIDQYRDALWRLLVRSGEAAGDRASARRNQERYQAVLRELGL